nr:Retrovirus-related Pol polyprotein from transposon TNT 1-94 [Ipomoea batatas]
MFRNCWRNATLQHCLLSSGSKYEGELYRLVFVDTPLAPYFSALLQRYYEGQLTQMSELDVQDELQDQLVKVTEAAENGMPAHTKGYLLYDTLDGSTFISRDVIFYEAQFPFAKKEHQINDLHTTGPSLPIVPISNCEEFNFQEHVNTQPQANDERIPVDNPEFSYQNNNDIHISGSDHESDEHNESIPPC